MAHISFHVSSLPQAEIACCYGMKVDRTRLVAKTANAVLMAYCDRSTAVTRQSYAAPLCSEGDARNPRRVTGERGNQRWQAGSARF
jgi:hypothetical protein